MSRWKWLDADQSYQVSTATTEKESERLVAIHNGALVPTAFPGVLALLDFAAIVVGGGAITETFTRFDTGHMRSRRLFGAGRKRSTRQGPPSSLVIC